MLWFSSNRHHRQARKLRDKVTALLEETHKLGRACGDVMEAGRQPGRLFTEAEVQKAADVVCAELNRNVRNPLAPLSVDGLLTVTVDMRHAELRARFLAGLRETLPVTSLAVEGLA